MEGEFGFAIEGIPRGGASSLSEDSMDNFHKDFNFGGGLDDIVRMAREFGEKFKEMAPDMGPIFADCFGNRGPEDRHDRHERHYRYDRPDFFAYPPVNTYTTRDGSLVLEFALAGIEERAVSVAFQGDYLVLNAKAAAKDYADEEGRFYRRGFKPRDIERQRYSVPAEDYAQDQAKAVFRNGVLTVTVPPKEPEGQGIKIEIVKEGN
jgi:HSP20 family protein